MIERVLASSAQCIMPPSHQSNNQYMLVASRLLALISVAFHVYLIFSGLLPNLLSRPLHLALALPWVFILTPYSSQFSRWLGYIFCTTGTLACGYIIWQRDVLAEQYGSLEGALQTIVAISLIVVGDREQRGVS